MSTNDIDHILTVIAQNHLGIETLETRNSDRLDFHDVSAGSVKAALLAAFMAGCDMGIPLPLESEVEIAMQNVRHENGRESESSWDIDELHEKFIDWVRREIPKNEQANVFELVAQTGNYPVEFIEQR